MKSVRRYRRAGAASPGVAPFQILSLSGGGYRGLFSAIILEDLENKAGKPLRECFDLVAGTSIGGILACGIATGVPAERIRKEFERLGAKVFERPQVSVLGRKLFELPRLGVLSARYSRSGLEEAVQGVLGDNAEISLASMTKPLIVPAVSATTSQAVVFESGRNSAPNGNVALKDVAFATSAAPTFFPEHNISGQSLVDGGIIANAPDVVSIVKAMTTFGRKADEIRLLSIGTTGAATGEVYRPNRASGILGWMMARNLFGLTVTAQQNLAVSLSSDLLGHRAVRVDYAADGKRGDVIGLDKVDTVATDTLKGLATQALEGAYRTNGGAIKAMLRHNASGH
jgi:patatin-like phospholipase/acyl hydrolase